MELATYGSSYRTLDEVKTFIRNAMNAMNSNWSSDYRAKQNLEHFLRDGQNIKTPYAEAIYAVLQEFKLEWLSLNEEL
jgi:hypothetical protein